MVSETLGLSPDMRAIVAEEEALLQRVQAALQTAMEEAAAKKAPSELRSIEALKELREEASRASEGDLPALLHEMSVRHRLLERTAEAPLPEPQSPYIAHLRVEEGKGRKDYLLGRANLIDTQAGVRVVDWRVAPVARIFYGYREGDEYEETFPGRVAEGVVEARRIVVITGGVLERIIGDGYALTRGPDGAWTAAEHGRYALETGGAGTAARAGSLGVGVGRAGIKQPADITALLDADQYAAVSTPPETPLLVLGSAGSGKTTVALHRLAWIAAREPARYPLSRTGVVVPEEGLARLSRRLLEPLGVGAAQVRTLDAWAIELAAKIFEEPLPALCIDAPGLVVSLKRHPAFHHAIRERFARVDPEKTTLKRLRRRLADALTDRSFLEGVVAASKGDLPRSAVEETVAHTMLQLAEPLDKALKHIVVRSMKKTLDGRAIAEGTPDELAGTLDVEDLPILLFIRAMRKGIDVEGYAHLVLDEAEDFALFEAHVLGHLLGEARSVTLAGDEAQQTSTSFAGWSPTLAALGVGDAAMCRLAISYRCPRPIAAFAQRLLGDMAPEAPVRAAREGAPVGLFHFPDESQSHLFVAGAVRDLLSREPGASIAVIAHEAEAAQRFHALLADVPEARLTLGGEFTFEPGVDVTDVDNVKGLEFDYVIVPDASAEAYPMNGDARRRLHVAVTRASHQLWVVSSGSPSPLIGATG